MKYLFDTDHISLLQRRSGLEYVTLVARISPYLPSDLAFSVVSLQEQALGANAYINRATTKAEIIRGYNLLHEIFESFLEATVLPFDMETATIFEERKTCTSSYWHYGFKNRINCPIKRTSAVDS